jgi:hypothetical protein
MKPGQSEIVTIVGLGLVALLVAGCSNGGEKGSSAPSSAAGTTTASSSAVSTPQLTASPTPGSLRTGDLQDGRHPVRIMDVDVQGRLITVDVVQLFLGDEAASAAAEDKAEEVPPPNDVWIRNESARLRTLPLAPGTKITVNVHGASESGSSTKDIRVTMTQLAAIPRLADGIFWVRVRGATVTGVAEQYLP